MNDPAAAPSFDPSSYSYLEGVRGEVPPYIRIGPGKLHFVSGVPAAALGGNGDFALRLDGAAGACFYQRRVGVWVATGA